MKSTSRLISAVVSLAIIAGSIYGIINHQKILDAIALHNYQPSSRITAIADETTMKDPTRRVFYANRPQLNDKKSFRNNCIATEQSIVLGCFIERRGIYLLDVDDARLDGVIQVTAAHEVLHAQYERLSSKERKRIDALTNNFYSTITNDRIKKTVEQYRKNDPSVVPNELHSILATEVRNLPPELELYYSQYFKDRGQIVALSEKYEQTFVNLNKQVEEYDEQLKNLKATIDSNQNEIEGLNNELDNRKNRLDSLMNSGRTEEYNAAVPEFNAQVASYNALINRTRSLIAQYNAIVEKRNGIATTEQELIEAIDTNKVPKPAE